VINARICYRLRPNEGAEMSVLKVHEKVSALTKDFKLPEEIGFGKILSPVMIQADYKDGKWQDLELVPYQNLELDPTCKVFHYGQEIYEGMKAYYVDGKGPFLFRPKDNHQRFNQSAKRMAMPELPESYWMDGLEGLVSASAGFIPNQSGESLYIRPFMIATENHLGIKPSTEFKFIIVASPSASYFTGGSISVLIEREYVRACPGGTGNAKTGGNYAAALQSALKAQKVGLNQSLWLDAIKREFVEEMSGMNFFCVIDGEIHTPEITDTILAGITRDSLLKIAQSIGYKVNERQISITEIIELVKSGKCTEAFACGTAVILTPIGEFGEESGERFPLKDSYGPVAKELRQAMLDIQEGRRDIDFDWRYQVN
jgi:branched-chain amino acid aminotransferase